MLPLLPITYYLLPITYYLLPITYYLLPITQISVQMFCISDMLPFARPPSARQGTADLGREKREKILCTS